MASWVAEDDVPGATPTGTSWQEETPPTWGDFAKSLYGGAANMALIASNAIPGWERARAVSDVLTGGQPSYDEAIKAELAKTAQAREQVGPFMASTGDIAGGAALGTGLARAGITTAGRIAGPLWQRILGAAGEAGLYGGVQGASNTYTGNPYDYLKNAGWGASISAPLGAALPAIGAGASAVAKALSDRWSGIPVPVLKAGRVDAAGLADLPKLGPNAMLADAGPTTLGVAQGAAQGAGANRSAIVNAVIERDKGTVPRLQADRQAVLGPAPRVSQIEDTIEAGRKAINANDYTPVMRGRAMSPQGADTAIAAIDRLGQSARVDMGGVKNTLILPGTQNLPDLSPQTWLNARHNVDSMITQASKAGDRYTAGILGQARDVIDNELAANVPGIKAVDAKFAANRAELEALERGQQVLDKGKQAIHPEDLRDVLTVAPPAVQQRFQQGAHADLARKLGTQSNDLAELERTLGTPEDWNAQKMAILYGPAKAKAITDSVARERIFRDTRNEIVGGPNTAQKLAAREDLAFRPVQPGSVTLWGDIKSTALKPLNWMLREAHERQRDAIAQVMAMRDPAQVMAMRDAIMAQNARTDMRGPVVSRYTQAPIRGGVTAALPQWTNLFPNEEQ